MRETSRKPTPRGKTPAIPSARVLSKDRMRFRPDDSAQPGIEGWCNSSNNRRERNYFLQRGMHDFALRFALRRLDTLDEDFQNARQDWSLRIDEVLPALAGGRAIAPP